jgi:hypothetical protein
VLERLGLVRWVAPTLRRLDRAAEAMNPFLLTVVIGLVVVNVSCYMALEIGRLHAQSHGPSPIAVPGPTFGQIAASGLPGS